MELKVNEVKIQADRFDITVSYETLDELINNSNFLKATLSDSGWMLLYENRIIQDATFFSKTGHLQYTLNIGFIDGKVRTSL